MKKNLLTAVLMTIATTILFGIVYPFVSRLLPKSYFRTRRMDNLSGVEIRLSARV